MEYYPYLGLGRGEHYGPAQLKTVWPLLKNVGSIEEYSVITIARNPLDTLVSYYWYAHSRITLYGYWEKTVPRIGDTNEVIRNKFQEWSREEYRCPIFKEHVDKTPLETPYMTISRINEPQVDIADVIIKYSNLQEECKNKLDIQFALPKFKTTERSVRLDTEYYFKNDNELKDSVITSMPINMEVLRQDLTQQKFIKKDT